MFAQKLENKTDGIEKQLRIQFNNICLLAKEYEYMNLYRYCLLCFIDKQSISKNSKKFENGSTSTGKHIRPIQCFHCFIRKCLKTATVQVGKGSVKN